MSTFVGPLWERLLDRLDLLIDFSTLGEYGLECVAQAEAASGPVPALEAEWVWPAR